MGISSKLDNREMITLFVFKFYFTGGKYDRNLQKLSSLLKTYL